MMEGKNTSAGTWADQWDSNSQDPHPLVEKMSAGGGSRSAKYKEKVEKGLVKTKSAASQGVKKVKEGTTVGLHWIKDKYQKTASFGKR